MFGKLYRILLISLYHLLGVAEYITGRLAGSSAAAREFYDDDSHLWLSRLFDILAEAFDDNQKAVHVVRSAPEEQPVRLVPCLVAQRRWPRTHLWSTAELTLPHQTQMQGRVLPRVGLPGM